MSNNMLYKEPPKISLLVVPEGQTLKPTFFLKTHQAESRNDLPKRLTQSFRDSLSDSLRDSLSDSLRDSLSDSLRDSLSHSKTYSDKENGGEPNYMARSITPAEC